MIATPLPILDNIIENKPKVKNEDGDITITASYAIFYKDDESETPASVAGFEFLYSSFYRNFMKITERNKEKSEVSFELLTVVNAVYQQMKHKHKISAMVIRSSKRMKEEILMDKREIG